MVLCFAGKRNPWNQATSQGVQWYGYQLFSMISWASKPKGMAGLDWFEIHNICQSVSDPASSYHLEWDYIDGNHLKAFFFLPQQKTAIVEL